MQPQAKAAAAAKARAVAKQEAEAKAERRKQEPVPEEVKPQRPKEVKQRPKEVKPQQPKEVKIAEQPQPTPRSKPKPEPKLKQRDRTTTAQAADPSVLWTLLETLDLSHHSEALKAAGFGDLESLGMAVPLDLTDVGLTEAEASKLLDAPARRSRSFTMQLMQSRQAEEREQRAAARPPGIPRGRHHRLPSGPVAEE